ncbi:TRAP transporter small permease subunit [Szabonella alba]|uniref:TRAP transporter small permease protein n=1 Tax=Szabonella alba TaxID=2804194 RepID=A0A8K0Y207_9RHOB|nr:TRAP transporter small permease subunit [Szabonella alba]
MQAPPSGPDVPAAVTATDGRAYAIDRMIEPVRWVFRLTSLVVLATLIALPFIQVVLREVLSTPIVGVEELTRFMLICSVFLAFPYVVSAGASIRMEEILAFLPSRIIVIVRFCTSLIAIAAFAILAFASLYAISRNMDNATPTLGIPYYIFFGAAFAGFTMTCVECLIQLFKALQGQPLYITFRQEQEPPQEFDITFDPMGKGN